MDTLSNVLESVRFESARFVRAEFSAPWSLRSRRDGGAAGRPRHGAEHAVCFYYLTEGACKVRLQDGADVLELVAGDLVLLPRDDDHVIASHLHVAPLDA